MSVQRVFDRMAIMGGAAVAGVTTNHAYFASTRRMDSRRARSLSPCLPRSHLGGRRDEITEWESRRSVFRSARRGKLPKDGRV